MKIENVKQLSAENLRVIILALKMEEFNIDDEKVKNEVYENIKKLPSAEKINLIAANDRSMDELRNRVSYICDLVDKHESRDIDYKTRYRARTGLNPRYKVLDYRVANKEIKMKKEAKMLVKQLVIASSIVDNKGHSKMAEVLVKCAKDVKSEAEANAIVKDIISITASLRSAGFNDEADRILKEAGIWSGIKGLGEAAWQGVKGIGQQVGNAVKNVGQQVGQAAKNVGTGIKETYQLSNLKGTFADINNKVKEALDYATGLFSSVTDPTKKQKIGELTTMLQNMQTVGAQVYNVVIEDESQAAAPQATSETANQSQAPAEQQPVTTSQPAATPQATSSTPSIDAGKSVKWQSSKGNPISGVVVGPSSVQGETIVKLPNGQPASVKTDKLKAASTKFNLRKYIQG